MFKNLRIGARLGLGFGLVLVLMAALAATSENRLDHLNGEVDAMINDRFPKTVWANDVIDQINVVARAARNAILVSKPEEIQKELNRIPEARKAASEAIAKLEKSITSEAGKKVLGNMIEKRKAFGAELDRFIEIAKSGKRDDALAHLLGPYRKAQDDYMLATKALIDFQVDLMKTSGEAADRSAEQAQVIVAVLAIAALLIGIGFAFWVTRSITRPINEAVGAANALAEGDLSVNIQVDSKDEVGQLLAAMQAMAGKLGEIIGEVRT
ncbi:MAG: MCP four helix bundle domain-containing protein, partial [Candidatus Accumulibacter sp.]